MRVREDAAQAVLEAASKWATAYRNVGKGDPTVNLGIIEEELYDAIRRYRETLTA